MNHKIKIGQTEWVSAEMYAMIHGVTRRTVYNWIAEGSRPLKDGTGKKVKLNIKEIGVHKYIKYANKI